MTPEFAFTFPVKVEVPSMVRLPFAWMFPALLILTPVDPYPPPILFESNEAAAELAVNEVALAKFTVALFIVVVPLLEPRLTEAAPPICKVVAVVLKRLAVVWVVAIVPELALMFPVAVRVPPVERLPFAPVNEK